MVELLPLKSEHCEIVAEISKECLPEYWSADVLRDTLHYDNNIYFIAIDMSRNIIVGYAGIMIIADEAELLNIAVTHSYRKMGIGQMLLDRMLVEARQRQSSRMLLEVRQSNTIAYSFYCNNRFVKIGERKNYYSNPQEDAIIMEKML